MFTKRILAIVLTGLIPLPLCLGQGPWLGGQQEIAVGIHPVRPEVLGLYVNRVTEKDVFGNTMNSTEIRLGWMGWSVKSEIFMNEECQVLDTDAQTTVTVNIDRKGTRKTGYYLRQFQRTYVSSSGKILQEDFRFNTDAGFEEEVEAIYHKDSIDVTSVYRGKESKTTLFPPDMSLFQARFVPMIKDGKVILKEKKFAVLDPATLGVKNVTARVGAGFTGTIMAEKYTGNCVAIEYPEETQKVFISAEDELVKIELPAQRYLMVEETPPKKLEKLMHRGG